MVRISKLRIPYHPVSILYEINFQVSVSPLFSMKSCKTIHVQNSVRLFNVHFWRQPGMLHAQQKWWLSLYHSLKRPSHEMLYHLFIRQSYPPFQKSWTKSRNGFKSAKIFDCNDCIFWPRGINVFHQFFRICIIVYSVISPTHIVAWIVHLNERGWPQ